MKYNISKILVFLVFLFFTKYEIAYSKTNEENFLGRKDAKVVIIEYASMTCIHCANFHKDIYPKIKEKYIDTNIIKFVFRDFPLDKQMCSKKKIFRFCKINSYYARKMDFK